MCAQAHIERTVSQLSQQDAGREHALLQQAQILQAEHQSLQDQYRADQAAISESMAFLNFELALEDKCGLKMGGGDASTSGIPAPTPAPTRMPTASPVPIPALFAAPHTTAKPPQLRSLTEDELGTSKAHSSTIKGDGAMESSVASERADQMAAASSEAPLHLAGLLAGDQSDSSEFVVSYSEAPSSGNDELAGWLEEGLGDAQPEPIMGGLDRQDHDLSIDVKTLMIGPRGLGRVRCCMVSTVGLSMPMRLSIGWQSTCITSSTAWTAGFSSIAQERRTLVSEWARVGRCTRST